MGVNIWQEHSTKSNLAWTQEGIHTKDMGEMMVRDRLHKEGLIKYEHTLKIMGMDFFVEGNCKYGNEEN